MTQEGALWPATPLLLAVLCLATWTDVRRRQVPAWLSLSAIAGGLAVAVLLGHGALAAAMCGLVAGAVPLLPFVALGAFGGADLLLLAAIGIWEGWAFVLRVICWMALTGAVLAVIAWRRGNRSFAYVPAITIGVIAALAVPVPPL